jgi:sirohydrochlorin cobaltochelatase
LSGPALNPAAEPALVLFAHGARDPQWAEPFKRIQAAIRAQRPGAAVELAFLEIMQPPLADAIAALAKAGHRRITIAPLFMAQGGHLRSDVPRLLDAARATHPGVEFTLLPAVGDVETILNAIADWLVAALPH